MFAHATEPFRNKAAHRAKARAVRGMAVSFSRSFGLGVCRDARMNGSKKTRTFDAKTAAPTAGTAEIFGMSGRLVDHRRQGDLVNRRVDPVAALFLGRVLLRVRAV